MVVENLKLESFGEGYVVMLLVIELVYFVGLVVIDDVVKYWNKCKI